MKNKILLSIALVVNIFSANGQTAYPTPPGTDKMLFYIQRSHNQNTIIYDLNLLPDGGLNKKKPINVYWIRYEEKGQIAEMSTLQLKAFGIHCRLIDNDKVSFVVSFNLFDKREILLSQSISGKYKAYIRINGELAELSSAFIKAENNLLGMPIVLEYIEFKGISVKSRKEVLERMKL